MAQRTSRSLSEFSSKAQTERVLPGGTKRFRFPRRLSMPAWYEHALPKNFPLRLEPHLANQGAESRLIPQSIEDGLHLKIDQPVVTLLKCAFQPFDSSRTLAQPCKNHCLAVLRRVADF